MVKKPVTIHMPTTLRTALRHAAAEHDTTMSDFVVSAIEASLRGGTSGVRTRMPDGPRLGSDLPGPSLDTLAAPILKALAEQAASIDQIRDSIARDRKGAGSETVTPQAIRVGAAARASLGVLGRAGAAGVQVNALRTAMRGGGVSMAAMDAVIAVLGECRIVARRGHRWILADR